MQVDRIIKRVKDIEPSNEGILEPLQIAAKEPKKAVSPVKLLMNTKDSKVLVIRVFDIIGKASTLKDIQHEFYKLTRNPYPIREVLRSLNKSRVLVMVRIKFTHRGVLWIRSSWLENGRLMDEHKPEGFDDLYNADELIFE